LIPTNYAKTHVKNPKLVRRLPDTRTGNVAWLQNRGARSGVLLLGGTSLADFRIRVSQSQLRQEMTPSCWSVAGILVEKGVWTVPLLRFGNISNVPMTNAIELVELERFDDPGDWPNLAVLRFAGRPTEVTDQIERLREQRSIIDLPSLIPPWLGYVWGTKESVNPLISGVGLPSAAFVETVHALAQIELTPSLASTASCPEAIWQSARYWYEYFDATAREKGSNAIHPSGDYVVRQHSAAVRLPDKPDAAALPRGGAAVRRSSRGARKK
jgi:hypothetical protein